MAKLSWDDFLARHTKGVCLYAHLSWTAPKGKAPNGKSWPTAAALLEQVFIKCVENDWTSRLENKVLHAMLQQDMDVGRISRQLTVNKMSKKTLTVCSASYQLEYREEQYNELARTLGYFG